MKSRILNEIALWFAGNLVLALSLGLDLKWSFLRVLCATIYVFILALYSAGIICDVYRLAKGESD